MRVGATVLLVLAAPACEERAARPRRAPRSETTIDAAVPAAAAALRERWRADVSAIGLPHSAQTLYASGAFELVAIDIRTGRERWRAATADPIRHGAITAAGDRLLLHDDEWMASHSDADGTRGWTLRTTCQFSGLATAGVRAAGICRHVGRPAKAPPGEMQTIAPLPTVGPTELVVLDLEAGRVLWRKRVSPDLNTECALDGARVYVNVREPDGTGAVVAYDRDAGRVLWRTSMAEAGALDLVGDLLFHTGQSGHALRASDGTIASTFEFPRGTEVGGTYWALPTGGFHDGQALVVLADRVQGIDLASGRMRDAWELPRAGTPLETHGRDAVIRVQAGGGRVLAWLGADSLHATHLVLWKGDRRTVVDAPPGAAPWDAEIVGDVVLTRAAAGIAAYDLEAD